MRKKIYSCGIITPSNVIKSSTFYYSFSRFLCLKIVDFNPKISTRFNGIFVRTSLSKIFSFFFLLLSLISYGQEYSAQIIKADIGSPTWCPGETRVVSVTIKNVGTKAWKDEGTNDFNIGIKWNTNGTSWNDYHVRVDAQNLAPNETKTYQFSIRASNFVLPNYTTSLPPGTNNLAFDVVYEHVKWFGNTYTTPNQTIGANIKNNTLSYSNGTSGQVAGVATENNNILLNAPAGTYFSTVNFASYGTPTGTSPNFFINPNCHSAKSQGTSEDFLLGNSNATIPAANAIFDDPCVGTGKKLAVVASYVQPICNGASVTITGSVPTGVSDLVTYQWQSSTISATTGFGAAGGINNAKDYTSGSLTQTTWFRRIVTSCTDSNTSSVVLVKVNENPTITTAANAATICAGTSVQTANLPYTATTGAPTTYSISWNSTPANSFVAVLNAPLLANSIAISVPANTAAGTYTGRLTVKNATGCISSAKTFTVTVNGKPAISAVSAPGAACAGGSVNPNAPAVTTNGSPVTSSGWQIETAVGSGIYSNITLPYFVSFADNGKKIQFYAVNGCGTSISNTAVLAVNNIPTIGTITIPSAVCAGGTVNLIAPLSSANGSGITSSGWQLETTVGSGTFANIMLPFNASAADHGKKIRYYATNACGTGYSNVATLTVNDSPTVTSNKVDETCPTSNNGTISPVLSGGLSNVRYIKLTQKFVNPDAWQQVQEIQAFEIFTGTNLALATSGSTATASSVYQGDAVNYGPQKAIDGNFGGASFWHSNSPNVDEYITVDLKSGKNLDYLRIYNRSDCCSFRGQNMLLELFDASNKLVYTKTVDLWGGIDGAHYIDVNVLDVAWLDGSTTLKRTGLDAGTYTVNFADAVGCSTRVPINIGTANPGPSVGAASSTPTVCLNAPISPITHATTGISSIGGSTGLPNGVTAAWATNKITISGTPTAAGTYNYSIVLNGPCGNATATGTITVSGSTSTNTSRYISRVQFVGTLNPDTDKSSRYTAPGYSNYKAEAAKALQIPGGVINLNVNVAGPSADPLSTIKAWVDWNKNGVFETSEKVYDTWTAGALTSNVIFGYAVPPGTAPGNYAIRIKASGQNESTFGPCDNLLSGETEDYSFDIISDCNAKITSVTAAQQCGPGRVLLTAVGSESATSYLWYDSEFGNPIPDAISNQYTTQSLTPGRYIYYVAASSGSCTSTFRTPVTVVISPTPTITFTQSQADICGESASLKVISSGDQEEVTLLQENFDDADNFEFINVIEGNTDINAVWQVKSSPFVPAAPPYNTLTPAISAGYNGGNFATIITDVKQSTSILNHFTLKNNLNTTGFTNLKLDFDLYYFSEEDLAAKNYLKVQYSIDGGVRWNDQQTYLIDQGVPSRFKRISLQMPSILEGQTQLKIRFSVFALGTATPQGGVSEWIADAVGLDNVRLYGNKPLNTPFTWSSSTVNIYNSDCVTPYSGASKSICVKPTDAQIENNKEFIVTATATLSNGCFAGASTTIQNSNKVWNNPASTTTWSTVADWKPIGSPGLPSPDKCVIVKTPVNIPTNTLAYAKNVVVKSAGKLNIASNSSLTVTDEFINNANPADVVIESDGGLIQINNIPTLNVGNITAKRSLQLNANRQQYNYMISPLEGQSLKTVYPGIDYVLYHNEATNYFSNSSGAYIKGRGLAVKEPNKAKVPAEINSVSATFTGYPTNGTFSYNLVNSAPGAGAPSTAVRGYNLIGNPYPSNIDLDILYTLNGGKTGTLSSTFYFWDSTVNNIYVQQGSTYGGQSYGQFNAVTPPGMGTGIPATGDINIVSRKHPTKIVKMGQAFMARSTSATTTLFFDNTVRTKEVMGDSFFGKSVDEAASADRYWLRLVSPTGVAVSIAMVYFPEGDNALTADDSFSMGGSDGIYSVVEGQKISINGRSSFNENDIIPLGTTHFGPGNYTISLGEKEGVFDNGQNIYLKDRQKGIITNLSANDYSFAATAGESTGRFEIIYQPETVLATEGVKKENLLVYRDGSDFVVKSSTKKITSIQVLDTSGRLILSLQPNEIMARIKADSLSNGIYILRIEQGNQVSAKKIIK